MKREKDKLDKRAEYIVNEINTRPIPITRAVRDLSAELFLSERTIWYDLQRGIKSAPPSKY